VGRTTESNERITGGCDAVRERGTRRSLERDQKQRRVLAATD